MSTTSPSPAAATGETVTDGAGRIEPGRWVRVLIGVASAAIALSLGHLVSVFTGAISSPAVLVGSQAVDAAPTPVKTVVIGLLGTADKPVLITGVVVVTLLLGAVIGLQAWRRPSVASLGIILIGAVGMIVALVRPGVGLAGAVPSMVAIVSGVVALQLLVNLTSVRPEATGTGTSRRQVFMAAGISAAVVALGAGGGAVLTQVRRAGDVARRMLQLPEPMSPAPAVPEGVQVAGNTAWKTSIEDFYRIDISLITPNHSAEDWSLTIDGLVDNPITLTYEDLLAMPMIERDITLTCVSNEVGGPYVGNARWLGVHFSEILGRIGVQADCDMLLSHSLDGGYTCSTPVETLRDGRDAMIAVGMNGEVLPDKNGFPARMVVPGLFGYVSATKWLSRLEFTRFDTQTAYWTDRGWADRGPVLVQSRIDVPSSLDTITSANPMLAGVAWAQHRGIERVEIRIDGGEWQETTLAAEASVDSWRQWSFRFDGEPGRHRAEVRATDGDGETQPEERRPVVPAGATGWHTIQFSYEP